MTSAELNQLFTRPISDRARGMLRAMRANKRVNRVRSLIAAEEFETARECKNAGYARMMPDGRSVEITGLGQAYLDALMRSV